MHGLLIDNDAGQALLLIAEAGPRAYRVITKLGGSGLLALAVGPGQLQLVWNLPKLGGTA